MELYKSNCLLESLKAFIQSRGRAKIYKVGKWSWIWKKKKFPHFYWVLDGQKYKFEAKYSDEPLLCQLWYEGHVKKYE